MLYGWLEVGASNVGVFTSQCKQDIILRTTNSNNKIIVGNQIYDITSGSNYLAGLYISSNNVGINKVPESNVQLDILGKLSINDSITFTESMTGVSNMPTHIVNSNNAFHVYYNGIQRAYLTNQDGIRVTDKVYSTSDFFAPAFNVTSDSNLKRDIVMSDPSLDSEKLSNINVYDFRFHNSSCNTKGFIAQQVEEVFPQAIQRAVGFVPSSRKPVFVTYDGIIIKKDLPFEVEVGERISALNTGTQCELMVYKMSESLVHVTGNKKDMGITLDITGKNGFIRTIDTGQLMALCFSSTRQLQERVSKLEESLSLLLESLSCAAYPK